MKVFVALWFIFIAFAGLSAQAPDTQNLNTIFSAAVNAVGNQGEIARVRSIMVVADCVGPKGRYTTSIVSFRENKTFFEQTYSYKNNPSSVFVNGDVVWEKIPGTSDYSLATPFRRLIVRLHEYQKLAFDFQKFFRDFELAGDENFEGRPSVKVRSKNELGMTTILYFDKETKRFGGYLLEIPGSNETVKNVFLEWKKIGGLMLPSVVRATDKQGDWTLQFHTIKLNAGDEKLLDIPPRIADMAELMRLHEQQKTAHLTYNAKLFIEMFAENLTQLQRGDAVTRTKAENLERFKAYFSSFKFQEWEDIKPPVIRIAKDGSMATKIVQKRVRGVYKDGAGKEKLDHTVFAWLEVWEKVDGKWKVIAVASTEKSGQN